MRRRSFLGTLITGVAGVSGCVGPRPNPESRFEGRSVPPLPRTDSVQWYHEVGINTNVYLEPATERLELDGILEFEIINNSPRELGCGHWNTYKLVDGEWYAVGPYFHLSSCESLPPDDTEEWALQAFNQEVVQGRFSHPGDGYTRGFLGGGEYAVVVGYGHPEDHSAALVEIVGEPAEITVTEDVRVEQEGDTVTITTPQYGDDEHPPDESFALTRVESADERMIAEEITAPGVEDTGGAIPPPELGLRNALAVMDSDIDRVVVRADNYLVDDAVGHEEETSRFEFRGQAYQATRLAESD